MSKSDGDRVNPVTGAREPRLYNKAALEQIAYSSAYREAEDPLYSERREITGLGTLTFGQTEGQVSILEGWYRDGSTVWIAGDDSPVLLRIEREPIYKDPKGRGIRPFSVLRNTPDLFMPYSISDAEMLEDHQHEASTFRNAAIDQATGNIMSPKGINRNMVRPEEVRRAWEEPNGTFEVDGDPREAVYQFQPGQMSGDFERIYENIRSEAQMVSGVSDISAGQPTAFGLDNSTATGMSIIREEANQRYRMKLKFIQIGMGPVATLYDYMDRQLSASTIHVPVERGFQPLEGSEGIRMVGEPGSESFASIDTSVNGEGLDYEIQVDAGAMAPPHQMEQAQRVRGFIMDATHPSMAPMVNWPEVLRTLIEAHGQMPEKLMIQGQPPVQVEQVADPGMVPVGPPEPVDQEPVGSPDGTPVGVNGNGPQIPATPL